jgi:arylsulfatase
VKLRGLAMKRAPLVVERALDWLAHKPAAPFFLFAHFFDSHWPYEPPVDYGVPVANAYEGEVAFMDHHVGKLLAGVERLGYALDETLIVLLSDHGEDLAGWYENDHAGERGHQEEEGHGCLLYDATQLVPLCIRWPGVIPQSREIECQVRLADVAPTIWDLLGISIRDLDGSSLLPVIAGSETTHRPAYSETYFREELGRSNPQFAGLRPLRSVRLSDKVKVIWEVGGDTVQVFDLVSDPNERKPTLVSMEAKTATSAVEAAIDFVQ